MVTKSLVVAAKGAALAKLQELTIDLDPTIEAVADCRRDLKGYLANARITPLQRRQLMLPKAAEVFAARQQLSRIVHPWEPIDGATATAVFALMFGALAKRKSADDENMRALLLATTQMFNPQHARLGNFTGLWKPPPSHPVVVAMAVMQLLSTSVFAPTPSEVREACERAHEKLRLASMDLRQWLERFAANEATLLLKYPGDWRQAYGPFDWTVRYDVIELIELQFRRDAKLIDLVERERIELNREDDETE
jgi:hypothetical protein